MWIMIRRYIGKCFKTLSDIVGIERVGWRYNLNMGQTLVIATVLTLFITPFLLFHVLVYIC